MYWYLCECGKKFWYYRKMKTASCPSCCKQAELLNEQPGSLESQREWRD